MLESLFAWVSSLACASSQILPTFWGHFEIFGSRFELLWDFLVLSECYSFMTCVLCLRPSRVPEWHILIVSALRINNMKSKFDDTIAFLLHMFVAWSIFDPDSFINSCKLSSQLVNNRFLLFLQPTFSALICSQSIISFPFGSLTCLLLH